MTRASGQPLAHDRLAGRMDVILVPASVIVAIPVREHLLA
jgi:hypothetical protein